MQSDAVGLRSNGDGELREEKMFLSGFMEKLTGAVNLSP